MKQRRPCTLTTASNWRWTRLLAAALLLFPLPAVPATITVDETVGLPCTLVDAITAANTDAATGNCPAGDGGLDIIELDSDVILTNSAGTYYSNDTGLPLVSSDITIEGNARTIERDATGPAFRILAVASNSTLTLNDVTIENGRAVNQDGGGIYNEGTAHLNNATLSGNYSGYQGGGIQNNGAATVTNSTLSGNTAGGGGGGFYNHGTATLTNSTLSGNTAEDGGGFYNDGLATLTNVTFSGNSADTGGGFLNDEDDPILTNCIVANSPSGGNCALFDPIIDGGNNFDDDGSCGAGFGAITDLDPVLASNGGPTQTHALLPGSSAIDAIPDGECVDSNAAALTTDQRGAPRPVDGDAVPGALCDSGSYEFAAAGACCTDGPGTNSPCVVTNEVDCQSGGGLFLGAGTECVSDEECTSLLVTMDTMSAVATGDGVLVRWTTALELDTAGFQVLREAAPNREKTEPFLIPVGPRIHAMGDQLNGASYELLDDSRGARRARRYYIEDTDLHGRVTLHGPVDVVREGREAPLTTGHRGVGGGGR